MTHTNTFEREERSLCKFRLQNEKLTDSGLFTVGSNKSEAEILKISNIFPTRRNFYNPTFFQLHTRENVDSREDCN